MHYSLCFTLLACAALVSATTLHELTGLAADNVVQKFQSREIELINNFNASLSNEGVYIRSGKLELIGLGNRLACYFEDLACSDLVGAHFIFKATVIGDGQVAAFMNAIPHVRVHPNAAYLTKFALNHRFKQLCPAHAFPHEYAGAWNRRPKLIAEILQNATYAVFGDVSKVTVPSESFVVVKSKDPIKSELPLIPTAAVLFRCVDILNFHGKMSGYGFLNFNAYESLIPRDVSHIYILTEDLTYEAHTADNRVVCTDLTMFLVEFLYGKYPEAVVALRRGHAVESFAMMTHTRTYVSAPSSFSLFPGIANPHRVYLMATGEKPLFMDQPFLRHDFMWLMSPEVIMGGNHAKDLAPNETIAILRDVLTLPLAHPVHFVSHVPKK